MPGSRRRGLSLKPPALRRRSGGEEQLTQRRAEFPAEEGAVESGAGRGLPAGEAACSPRAAGTAGAAPGGPALPAASGTAGEARPSREEGLVPCKSPLARLACPGKGLLLSRACPGGRAGQWYPGIKKSIPNRSIRCACPSVRPRAGHIWDTVTGSGLLRGERHRATGTGPSESCRVG